MCKEKRVSLTLARKHYYIENNTAAAAAALVASSQHLYLYCNQWRFIYKEHSVPSVTEDTEFYMDCFSASAYTIRIAAKPAHQGQKSISNTNNSS